MEELATLYVELAELYERAHRAIDEARTLSADYEFIRWWRHSVPRDNVRVSSLTPD
jgi:hypothetical protein